MAYERLVPGYRLTEKDVSEILRNGTKSGEYLKRREQMCIRSFVREPDDTAVSFLSSAAPADVPADRGKNWKEDPVYYSYTERRKQEEQYLRSRMAEMSRIRYARDVIRRVWDGFYALAPDEQDLLARCCIHKEPPLQILKELHISESTFWRRKKNALSRIARYCADVNEPQNEPRHFSGSVVNRPCSMV